MGQSPKHSSVHLLEDQVSRGSASPGARAQWCAGPGSIAMRRQRIGPGGADLRGPGFVMLAAASIFEGYRWLGAIPADHDLVSRLMFSRPGAAVFAVLALSGVVVLTGRAGVPRRVSTAVALPAAAVAVVTATLLLAVGNDTMNRSLLGATDLVMAVAAVAALVSGERRARPRSLEHASGSIGSSAGPVGGSATSRSGDPEAKTPRHSIPVT
jgi:hypothetical protein